MRKTKIICTLGPSTDKGDVLRDLIANGMNVARFNFSHGSYEEHGGRLAKLKALREELGKPVAALLDTKGPEIRLKEFKNGVEMLEAGQTFTLTTREVEGTKEICSVTYKDLPQDVQPGGTIMLDEIGRAGHRHRHHLHRAEQRQDQDQKGCQCARRASVHALPEPEGPRGHHLWRAERL